MFEKIIISERIKHHVLILALSRVDENNITYYRVGNQKLHSVCIIDDNRKCNFWFFTLYTQYFNFDIELV